MAQVVKTRTYGTNDSLSASNYNDDRDEVIAGVNSIDDSQISPSAAISEGKVNFSGSLGHTHNITSGTPIPVVDLSVVGLTPGDFVRVNLAGTALEAVSPSTISVKKSYVFYVGGNLTVDTNVSANPIVQEAVTVTKLSAYVKTPSTGADIIILVKKVGGATIATLTIPAGNNSAETSTITTPSLSLGDYLQMDVTQIGSGTVGSKLTASLQTTT